MTAFRCHEHKIELAAPPERVFALLHTPSDICRWWGAARVIVIPKQGGMWSAAWGDNEDNPEYVTAATMRVFDPPRRIVFSNYQYESSHAPLPFEADFITEFMVRPTDANGSILSVRQDGFPAGPEADDFYAGCEMGWHDTFDSIQKYLENART